MTNRLPAGALRLKMTLAAAAAFVAFAIPAGAQTLTLTSASDTTLRGGSYANTNYGTKSLLEIRAGSSDLTYERRMLLKFDTDSTIPQGTSITSAKLTITVAGGDSMSRTVDAMRESSPYTDTEATWNQRRTSTSWSTAGGDVAEKTASATITNVVGSKVTFDVTSTVQAIVNGTYGSSRYTRLELIDHGADTSASYKQVYSEEAGGGLGPVLTVVLGAASSAPTTTTTSGTRLKYFEYNTHHGVGTDGVYDLDRIASVVAKYYPDVVDLVEVEKYTSWGNEDQPAHYKQLLEQKTGYTWYYVFAQEYGQWTSPGKGNLLLSRFPFTRIDRHYLSYDRTVALGQFTVNGRNITAMATHLDPYDSTIRYTQAGELLSYASGWSENKMISGDMNAWPDQTSIARIDGSYYDAWVTASAIGTAYYYGSYTAGQTRSGRIDYVFYSKGASALKIVKMQLIDTEVNGVMPSDHRPIMATFTVQ
jgi:endonuclease/exonuclease/phosphatase family metal-dependent hydrolase